MDIRQELPLEQQFELQVFEQQVRSLSQEDAQDLLVRLKESMLYQSTTFREILNYLSNSTNAFKRIYV